MIDIGNPTAPWRKSIRSNASGGCVEVTWIDGARPGQPGEAGRPSK